VSDRVHELRLVVTAEDYDDALRFYRDVLGLPEREEFISPGGGRVTILEAGRRRWSSRTRRKRSSSTRSRWVDGSLGMSVSGSKLTTRPL